jgi:hypothetical protein
MQTALDLAKLNAGSDGTALIEANKMVAPELGLVPAFSVDELSYTSLRRISVPEGGFAAIGAGTAAGVSQYENGFFQCFQYKNLIEETKDKASAYRRGPAAFLALAMSGAYQGAMRLLGRAFYYGANTAPGGSTGSFAGMVDLYDKVNMVIDAGGTTDNTASSIWFIKFGNMEDGNVSFVFGNNRGLAPLATWIDAMVTPVLASPTLRTHGWQNELSAAVGLSLADPSCAVRVKKITADAGKGMTDGLGQLAMEKFPVGIIPDVVLMTRRTRRQLQQSRVTSLIPKPPLPVDVEGIPIVITDSISNAEALALG